MVASNCVALGADHVAYANSYAFLSEDAVESAAVEQWSCDLASAQTKRSERIIRCDHEGVEFDLTIEAGEVWQDLRELRISLPEPAQ